RHARFNARYINLNGGQCAGGRIRTHLVDEGPEGSSSADGSGSAGSHIEEVTAGVFRHLGRIDIAHGALCPFASCLPEEDVHRFRPPVSPCGPVLPPAIGDGFYAPRSHLSRRPGGTGQIVAGRNEPQRAPRRASTARGMARLRTTSS